MSQQRWQSVPATWPHRDSPGRINTFCAISTGMSRADMTTSAPRPILYHWDFGWTHQNRQSSWTPDSGVTLLLADWILTPRTIFCWCLVGGLTMQSVWDLFLSSFGFLYVGKWVGEKSETKWQGTDAARCFLCWHVSGKEGNCLRPYQSVVILEFHF